MVNCTMKKKSTTLSERAKKKLEKYQKEPPIKSCRAKKILKSLRGW